MTAVELHKMLDDFEAALRTKTQEVGRMNLRWNKDEMTPEDTDFAIDWQDDFVLLAGRLKELSATCNLAVGLLRKMLYE